MEFASNAAPSSSDVELRRMFSDFARSGALLGTVTCVSVTPAGRSDVMCLTAPEWGLFSTGGVIVSNCADEWRYACMSRPWTRELPSAPKQRMLEVGEGNQMTLEDAWATRSKRDERI